MKTIIALIIFLQAGAAIADIQMKQLAKGDSNEVLGTMNCLGNGTFAVGGLLIKKTGQSIIMSPKLFWGENNTVTSILGNMVLFPAQFGNFFGVNGVFFLDRQTGWAAVTAGMTGVALYNTVNGGKTWKTQPGKVGIQAIKFFDRNNGVAVALHGYTTWTDNGGTGWNTVTTGFKQDLKCMYWVDSTHGFAAGQTENDDKPDKGVVLETTDQGRTWTKIFETQGITLCPIFFLPDGKTGYLAAYRPTNTDNSEAILYKTTDGGHNFVDINLPLDVGQFNSMPIKTNFISSMYFDKRDRGVMVGSILLMKSQQSNKGQSTVYRNVTYYTSDGAKTWQKTDLGNIQASLMNPPPDEGAMMAGCFQDLANGWVSGSGGFIYSVKMGCTTATDCPDGYLCTDDFCESGKNQQNSDGISTSENTSSESNNTLEDTQNNSGDQSQTGTGSSENNTPSSGGCTQGQGPAGPWTLFVILGLIIMGLGIRKRV